MSITAKCFLCGQIAGEPDNDLIAHHLSDQSYKRRIFCESRSFAAIPSLGALVPGHVLLCPKDHICSFAAMDLTFRSELDAAIHTLRSALADTYGHAAHMFEHGMGIHSSRVPCTVDHAHLHVVPVPAEVDTGTLIDEHWQSFDGSLGELKRLTAGREYISYSTPDNRHWVAIGDNGYSSQHMRRRIAEAVGRPTSWDWRAEPDAELAHQTWAKVSELMVVA